MLNASRVMAFLAARDLSVAQKFYEDTLGLPLVGKEPGALVFEVKGTLVRIANVENMMPAAHTVLGWEVADIHRSIEMLTQKGVVFERFAGLPQDDGGVAAYPNGTQIAWFKDPDGNILSLTQF